MCNSEVVSYQTVMDYTSEGAFCGKLSASLIHNERNA
jgi:hypothetical protein